MCQPGHCKYFLSSSAADVNPFAPKHVLTCTLRTGAIDAHDLCIKNGRYYPMGKKNGKQIWRAANFSSFQYVEEGEKMELGRLAQQGCMHRRVVKQLSSAARLEKCSREWSEEIT